MASERRPTYRTREGIFLAFGPSDSPRPLALIRPSWWKPNRPSMPPVLRAQILERDKHTCQTCGAGEELQIDHIYPWSMGGDFYDPANLQVVCARCNRRKAASLPDEFAEQEWGID